MNIMHSKFFYILISTFLFTGNILSSIDQDSIKTSSGSISGYIKNKVLNYDDIPYAKPPVGLLRWKAPRELDAYDQIILSKDNNHCIQEPSSMGGALGNGILTGSEDCLYLDIKIPKKKSSKLLPVMFWIHGGGNTSGLKDIYDFSTMVNRHNVIVITIN